VEQPHALQDRQQARKERQERTEQERTVEQPHALQGNQRKNRKRKEQEEGQWSNHRIPGMPSEFE
jgi:hypothetical protein